jgi:hypothetical protein
MFRHVVMSRWSDDVDDADIAAISSALDRLPDAIPEIVAYHHGPDARLNDGNYDYVMSYRWRTVSRCSAAASP